MVVQLQLRLHYPGGATINGIGVRWRAGLPWRARSTTAWGCPGTTVRVGRTEKTDSYTTTTMPRTHLWRGDRYLGRTWTVAPISQMPNFQFRIHKISGTPNLEIDFIQIRVFYTLLPSQASSSRT